MPEGPEIALNVDLFLKPILLHKTLVNAKVLSGKFMRKKPINMSQFENSLPSKVIKVDKHGKFAWFELANGWIVGIGFGMSGRFTQDSSEQHNRIKLEINDKHTKRSSSNKELYYNDARNFGNWYFWKNRDGLNKKLSELGVDFLKNPKMSKKKVADLFRKYDNLEITKVLMSQKVMAGVGNYAKNEGLYAAKIYPYAKVTNLTDSELHNLYHKLTAIGKRAYKIQKHTFKEGVPYDDFQRYLKVYKKKRDPFGRSVIRSTNTSDNRTTHWVKEVQVLGKHIP